MDTADPSVGVSKVRKLIDDHIISLGVDPKIPPISITDAEFVEHVEKQFSPRAKASEEDALRPAHEFCGCSDLILRTSAIRLSSGSECAFIFRIRWVRCTFTVDSAMPIS